MTSRISDRFAQLRAQNRMAFMPFVTVGDPNVSHTQEILRRLSSSGVDLIEIGFPYSDPIADGPVIQASYTRALSQRLTVNEIFSAIQELKSERLPPLVAMVSYAIVFRTGVETFLERASEAGFSGLIVPDLPGDEAEEFFQRVQQHRLDLIQLVAPTTPRQRVQQILKACSGFVYCIAVAGTTGERQEVADALLEQLRWLKQETDLPLAVGFGISRAEHVAPLRGLADGVIVGSALVRTLQSLADGEKSAEETLQEMESFANEMNTAAHASISS